jgi:hypothetical protein
VSDEPEVIAMLRYMARNVDYGTDAVIRRQALSAILSEYDDLRARLVAAERDAARYAFVRDNMVSVEFYVPFMRDDAWVRVIAFDGCAAHKPTLDEAIDALATPTMTEDA